MEENHEGRRQMTRFLFIAIVLTGKTEEGKGEKK